jgi:thioredoxin 1
MSGEHVLHLSDTTFDEAIRKASGPVLVDFWAAWCAPCLAIAPVLDELAAELKGRATIAKVDVEAYGDLAARFGIRSIPALLVFKNGRMVEQSVGALAKDQLRRLLEAHL